MTLVEGKLTGISGEMRAIIQKQTCAIQTVPTNPYSKIGLYKSSIFGSRSE